MATGDVIGARILSNSDFSAQYNGCCIELTIEGLGTGGTYSDLGWDATNNVATSSPEITVNLSTYTFNTSQSAVADSLTVYGTKEARQEYPNEASAEEVVSGSDVKIYFWLSDFIYDDDNTITVDVAAGVYTESGTPNNSTTGYSVTNDSTLDVPAPCAKWSWPGYRKIIDSTFDIRIVGFHRDATDGEPLKYVKFSVTDEHINTETVTKDASEIDSSMPDVNKVIEFIGDFTSSDFTTLDELTCNYIAYGHRTNAAGTEGLLDSSDAVNSQPTPQYAPQTLLLDTGDTHGYAFVSSAGNDGTGTVYSSQAAAEAGNAYLTIPAAITAIQTWNNTYASHNDAGGGTITLKDESHIINTDNGGASYSAWLTIKAMTGHGISDTTITVTGTSQDLPQKTKIENVTIDNTGNYYWNGDNTDLLWLHQCDMATVGNVPVSYKCLVSYATYITGTMGNNHFKAYSTNNMTWAIIRGCDMDVAHTSYGYCNIGNNNVIIGYSTAGTPTALYGICAFNSVYDTDEDCVRLFLSKANIYGYAIVQNLFEITAATAGIWLAGDSSVVDVHNMIIWHNSTPGGKCNLGYNDADIAQYNRQLWNQRGNIPFTWNNKGDLYNAPTYGYSGVRVGGWPVMNNVGTYGNMMEGSGGVGFAPEFDGLSSVFEGDPDYVRDLSGVGGAGNGDYHLGDSSDALNLLASNNKCLNWDLKGNLRAANPNAGAYATVSGSSWYYYANQ